MVRADSLTALPSNSPVGSRMAIMLGGAAAGAAKEIRETLIAIAAHNFECSPEDLEYRDGDVSLKGAPDKKLTWAQLVEIAHRKFHRLPPGIEPGLQAKFVWQVPTGGALPTPEGRIQIYPCYAFEAHIVLVEIDPDTGKPAIRKYVCGHDCGVIINPDIVHGMTYGGIAHGIGAALYEKFSYTEDGQLASGTFMDYLIPSAMEVPRDRDRRSLHALPAHHLRAEGLGRSRLPRRAGRDRQCGERRARAPGRLDRHPADVAPCDLEGDQCRRPRASGDPAALRQRTGFPLARE